MSKPQEVTDADFEQEVLKSDLPVVVDFWAEWCGPCHQIAPILESLADEYDGKIKFVKVDTEENFETLSSYGVLSLPPCCCSRKGNRSSGSLAPGPRGT